MTYVHCPACERAYNLAQHPVCPACPVAATVVDPAEDIVTAADQLARALARATPAQRAEAAARVPRLALELTPPAPKSLPAQPSTTEQMMDQALDVVKSLAIAATRAASRRLAKYAPRWVERARAALAA